MTAVPVYGEPPDNWVDHVAVERFCRGGWIGRNLSAAEQTLAVQFLIQHGHGVTEVGRVLHISGSNASRLVRESRTDPKDNR